MWALPLLKALDILENLSLALGTVVRLPMMGQSVFQGAKTTLQHGIVISVPLATATEHDPTTHQQLVIHTRGILVALITMMQQPSGSPA